MQKRLRFSTPKIVAGFRPRVSSALGNENLRKNLGIPKAEDTGGRKPVPIWGSKIGAGFRPQKSAPIFDSDNRHGRKG